MATNPTKQLRDLLLWARKEKIILSSVTMGSLHVEIVRDHGLSVPSGPMQAPTERLNILEQHAGALLPAMRGEDVAVSEVNEPTEEDE
jgi:hypothetical protein